MWDSANVSGTVTSHASGLPLAQGRRVVPSGRLLFSSIRLTGSFNAGLWARLMALYILSFMWLTMLSRGALATRQPMQPSRVHGLIIYTSVWLTGLAAKSVGHCYPNGLVRESQTNWGDQWSINPITAVWGSRRKESGLSTSQRALEKGLVIRCNLLVPCILDVGELASPIHSASVALTYWSASAEMLSGRMDCWSTSVDASDAKRRKVPAFVHYEFRVHHLQWSLKPRRRWHSRSVLW